MVEKPETDAARLKKAMEEQFERRTISPLRPHEWAEVDSQGRTLRRGYMLPNAPAADADEWKKD